ncbi:MAG: class I SAM-dependent methyltransferase [Alphaproteobacteria bacterium]|nr:class I SAM-dependent methyltransferase [Alphaproteobacteria bacterium]
MSKNDAIGTHPCPMCSICGSSGRPLYVGLRDILLGAQGEWTIKQCSNKKCGLLWLDPMPLPDEIYKAYTSYPTHHDATKKQGLIAHLFEKAQRGYRARRFDFQLEQASLVDRVLGRILSLVPVLPMHMGFPFALFEGLPKGKILELGCGSGETMKILTDWGWTTEGLDFDPAAVSNAVAKGLNVRQGDLFSCGYAADSFDVVFSNHVIEHVPDPAAVLAECHRILRPGGRCIVVTPNGESIGHRVFKSAWRGLEHPRHMHIFTPGSLGAAAQTAGFSSLILTTSTRLAAAMYLPSMMVRQENKVFPHARIGLKIGAVLAHLVAYLFHGVSPKSGEELVLIGDKENG